MLPHLENYRVNQELKIYICNNYVCKNPVENIEDALKELLVS